MRANMRFEVECDSLAGTAHCAGSEQTLSLSLSTAALTLASAKPASVSCTLSATVCANPARLDGLGGFVITRKSLASISLRIPRQSGH